MTTRSRTSGAYLVFVAFMTPSSQELESPANPARFSLKFPKHEAANVNSGQRDHGSESVNRARLLLRSGVRQPKITPRQRALEQSGAHPSWQRSA